MCFRSSSHLTSDLTGLVFFGYKDVTGKTVVKLRISVASSSSFVFITGRIFSVAHFDIISSRSVGMMKL